MKKMLRMISLILSGVMLGSMIPTVVATDATPAPVNDTSDEEWEEIQKIVSQYYGEWTDTSYPGAISNRIPNTAILGNGDVGVSSAGDDSTKIFNISKGDFWEYNGSALTSGSISIGTYKPVDEGNLIPDNYKNVTVSSIDADHSDPTMAVNGQWRANGVHQGWVSQKDQGEYWMVVEFKDAITFDRWTLRNDNAARPGNQANNTKACEIQTSENGTEWTTVSSFSNNSADVINVSLAEDCTTKWVRLLVTKPNQGGKGACARIGAFELYNDGEYGANLALTSKGVKVTGTGEYPGYGPSRTIDGIWGVSNETSTVGWVSDVKGPHWLMLEFPEEVTFNRWVVRHHNAVRPEQKGFNTKDFELQISDDGTNWRTVSTVMGNAENVTDIILNNTVTTKWVRLYITGYSQISGEPRARIGAFELYNGPEYEGPVAEEEYNTNLALISKGVRVTGTGEFPGYGPSRAVDGECEAGTDSAYNGWVSDVKGPHWLMLEFPEAITFNRWVVRHHNAVRIDQAQAGFNTKDFELQISGDGITWETIDAVVGNSENVTDIMLDEEVTTRRVRLYITGYSQISGEPRARIGAFELYNMKDVEGAEGNEEETLTPPSTPETEPEETIDFYEKMDILNANVLTQQNIAGVPMQIESWMSATNNLFVMKITSLSEKTDANVHINLEGYVNGNRSNTAEITDGCMLVTRSSWAGNRSELADIYETTPYVSKVAMATKIIGAEGLYELSGSASARMLLNLQAGETVYVVTAVCGGGRTYTADGKLWEGRIEPVTEALELIGTVNTVEDVETLHSAHLNWWKDYWMQSYISLDTTDKDLATLQKYYYAAQYLLGSGVREGNIGAGLYGIWHTGDGASWYNDYHLNYNFNATYYGVASSNRTSMLLTAVQAIMDYVPQGIENAGSLEQLYWVDHYNIGHIDRLIELGQVDPKKGIENAVLYPVGIGPYGITVSYGSTREHNAYQGQTSNAPFSAYSLVEYYEFTQDKEFMENTLYVYLEYVLNFLEAWLVEEDGQYVLYASWREGGWAKNPTVELMSYKMCLKYGIQIAKELGDDEKAAKWQDIYDNMAPQPVLENYDGKGNAVLGRAEQYIARNDETLTLIDGPSFDSGENHNNVSIMEAVRIFKVFGYYSTEEELEILQNTIAAYTNKKGAWPQDNNFPKIFTTAINSRYDCETVVSAFANVIRQKMKANLMIDDGQHGIEKAGAVEAINSMMLLGDHGVVKVFGNWLEDKDASFTRLRAPGAFLFSADYDGDTKEIAEGVTMYSEAGATATVASMWDEGMIVLDENGNRVKTVKGTAPNHEDEITYTFATEAGKTYTFVKKTENIPVDGVSLDKTEATLIEGATVQLIATVDPTDADDMTLTWSSSNEAVATVDANGKVTAVGLGEATITVTTTDGNKTATCVITVALYIPPDTTVEDTTADTTPTDTSSPIQNETTPVGETTDADDTTSVGEPTDAGENTAADETVATDETTAAEASGCKASIGAASVAAVLISAAGAVVLKKKEE